MAEQMKIPAFIGVNDPELLKKIITLIQTSEETELVLMTPEKYKSCIIEWQYDKMDQRNKESIKAAIKDDEVHTSAFALANQLDSFGIHEFTVTELRDFYQNVRKVKNFSISQSTDVIDVMFAYKYCISTNPSEKFHLQKFQLTLQDEQRVKALELRKSAISDSKGQLEKELSVIDLQIADYQKRIAEQQVGEEIIKPKKTARKKKDVQPDTTTPPPTAAASTNAEGTEGNQLT